LLIAILTYTNQHEQPGFDAPESSVTTRQGWDVGSLGRREGMPPTAASRDKSSKCKLAIASGNLLPNLIVDLTAILPNLVQMIAACFACASSPRYSYRSVSGFGLKALFSLPIRSERSLPGPDDEITEILSSEASPENPHQAIPATFQGCQHRHPPASRRCCFDIAPTASSSL